MSKPQVQSKGAAAAVDPLEAAKRNATGQNPPAPAAPAIPEIKPPDVPVQLGGRVVETKKVSLQGLITEVRKGQVITLDGYSRAGIESMLVQGVKFEPLE